jgi:hypothetical protein
MVPIKTLPIKIIGIKYRTNNSRDSLVYVPITDGTIDVHRVNKIRSRVEFDRTKDKDIDISELRNILEGMI